MAYSDFCWCDDPCLVAILCHYCGECWVSDGMCEDCGGVYNVCGTCDSVQT